MPRRVDITVSPEDTDALIADLTDRAGIASLKVQRGGSLRPAGDAITVVVANRVLAELHRMLQERGIGRDEGSTFTTSPTMSVVSAPLAPMIERDINDASWEEMDSLMATEAGANANLVGLMGLAGALAAFGLATGALHLVIGAMVIAPGFEPIARIGLAVVTRGRTWRHGLLATALGYLSLLVGAFLVALILRGLDHPLLGGRDAILSSSALVGFWTTVDATGLLSSVAAGLAGSLLVAANRSELTIGAMIGLSLIPSLALIPLALLGGETALLGRGLLRWGLDVAIVMTASLVVFGWKRLRVQRRPTLD